MMASTDGPGSDAEVGVRTPDQTVMAYVAVARALERLELVDPERSARLRMRLNRARAALNGGTRGDWGGYGLVVNEVARECSEALAARAL
ncbi:hypothetical protein [Nocardioides alkalitolerans]|uniref:hypothetical protein n=1 Tax=Nocardioides alkalitolerans TaxID=281714 RepID=UPI00048D1FC1|nr:hypothetical protein [Nocardioides alkalitolerans]